LVTNEIETNINVLLTKHMAEGWRNLRGTLHIISKISLDGIQNVHKQTQQKQNKTKTSKKELKYHIVRILI
jgi:sulfatase maturation enzyme AslB (radical SAM superfamily)